MALGFELMFDKLLIQVSNCVDVIIEQKLISLKYLIKLLQIAINVYSYEFLNLSLKIGFIELKT